MRIAIRNDSPTVKTRNTDVPNISIRERDFLQNPGTSIMAGTPIGLLLALTYADNFTTGQFSSFPGNVRIRTTD